MTWTIFNYTPNLSASIIFTVVFLLMLVYVFFMIIYNNRFKIKVNDLQYSISGNFSDVFDPENNKKKALESIHNSSSLNITENLVNNKKILKKLNQAYLPLLFGCALEGFGYLARIFSAKNSTNVVAYSVQSVFILVAPSCIAATIYMIYGRLLHMLHCEKLLILPSKWSTKFFVIFDIISFLFQAGGGGLMSVGNLTKVGSGIIIAGLFIQLVAFTGFCFIEFNFLLQYEKQRTIIAFVSRKWKFLNYTLIVSSALILIRSVVRVIEFIEGFDGYIASHEWFLFVFDAVPMFLCCILFAISMNFFSVLDIFIECNQIGKIESIENNY